MEQQRVLFESGNEVAAYAAKQINYHVMGYYPITPSTQIAEFLDQMKADGEHEICMIPAEGEHSAAGICYGASTGGGRVFNATSANGLMNTGWIILFANTPQAVYDMNICALKIAEQVKLPVIVAFDGFFTSHQKRRCMVFEKDETVQNFIGKYDAEYSALDLKHPVSIGSYMNEPDVLNNKFQLHQAMESAKTVIPSVFDDYFQLSGRQYATVEGYRTEDAEVVLHLLGSAYHTAKVAVDQLREQGKKVGVFTTNILRPYPAEELYELCKNAKTILVGDRQDSYGAKGGNLSLELKAMLQEKGSTAKVLTRIYGLGGKDFYEKDAEEMLLSCYDPNADRFDYFGKYPGEQVKEEQYFAPLTENETKLGLTKCIMQDGKLQVEGGRLNETTEVPKRIAPGHGACPGCGIPVNLNLLLRGIEGNVVLLFQTGCGMVVTTGYPKTAFKVPYVHNLFQNGAATLTGLSEMFRERQKRGEYPDGEITFIMVSGDGGMDIGMGSALGTAIRNNRLILFEYDNGGYMNTGYQLSYSTPMGAKSSTSHVGQNQYGKPFFNKDMPQIMAATGIPYVATAAESNPVDFIKKAAKAQHYAQFYGMAYIKAISACPLNWGDKPNLERKVIGAAVDSCYFPLYEVEQGITTISYDPGQRKIPVTDWLKMMGRTKHLTNEKYKNITDEMQKEIDRRWEILKAKAEHKLL